MHDHVLLYLNGVRLCVRGRDAFLPLSEFVRARQLTGVKVVCGEGACGACTVLVGTPGRPGSADLRYHTVNACLHTVFQMNGRHVVTVEGLSDGRDGLSAVQTALVAGHGTQCGFCTPGIVASLTAACEQCVGGEPLVDGGREALAGNLCRCTGYLPILQAAQSMETAAYRPLGVHYPAADIAKDLATHASAGLMLSGEAPGRLFQPATWDAALQFHRDHPDATVLAGGTQWTGAENLPTGTLLSLFALSANAQVIRRGNDLFIDAATTWAKLADEVKETFPALADLARRVASPQIRQTGTIGGNIAGAEANADLLPLLLLQEAQVHLGSVDGARALPIAAFLQGGCPSSELVTGVTLPLPTPDEALRLYKVTRRQTFDRAVFNAAVSLQVKEDTILSARVACGGVGPTPMRLARVEAYLNSGDIPFTPETMQKAGEIAAVEIAPVDDAYASANYRRQLAAGLLLRYYHEVIGA